MGLQMVSVELSVEGMLTLLLCLVLPPSSRHSETQLIMSGWSVIEHDSCTGASDVEHSAEQVEELIGTELPESEDW